MAIFISIGGKWMFFSAPQVPLTKDVWLAGAIGVPLGLCLGCLPFLFGSRSLEYGWRSGVNRRPDLSRPLVIVADLHWSDELKGLQQASMAMPDADWLFLGDTFDVWIGVKGFETMAERNFLWWVAERRRTGHWVGLWLGNREYFLDRLAHKFDFMGEGVGGTLQGEPFTFEHGDLINSGDLLYRLWNLFSRSVIVWFLAKIIPSFVGRRIASLLERLLQTTNSEYKVSFPTEKFLKATQGCSAPLLVTGHFHTLEEVDYGVSIPWAKGGRYLVWQSSGHKIVRFMDPVETPEATEVVS
jgi:UDP-2,3-diacylglucosamine pyrophosphatase LpxH